MKEKFDPIDEETENIASKVIESAFRVHRELGPGLLESVYETCMCFELREAGVRYERQTAVEVVYRGTRFPEAFRIDILIEGRIVIEVKAVDQIHPIHEAQLLTYMKLAKCRLGFILNLNVAKLKDGICRRVL